MFIFSFYKLDIGVLYYKMDILILFLYYSLLNKVFYEEFYVFLSIFFVVFLFLVKNCLIFNRFWFV